MLSENCTYTSLDRDKNKQKVFKFLVTVCYKKNSSTQLYLVDLVDSRDLPPCWLSQVNSRGRVSKGPWVENDVSVTQCVPNGWSYNFSRNNMKENHSSRWIKHTILVSRIIVIRNHRSRRLPKSRFTRKRKVISQFTGNKTNNSRFTKIPFTTLYIVFLAAVFWMSRKKRLRGRLPSI